MATISEMAASQTTVVHLDEGHRCDETHFSSRDGSLSDEHVETIIQMITTVLSAI
jgi:hypothetical protein